ncbi:MAG TPA: HD domain-containing phosphohydrolase, partial [Rhodocyclaceae bacterium]|nr:HD domain-containing phosphohydrolase [Rhodocyclaceae bacterium]
MDNKACIVIADAHAESLRLLEEVLGGPYEVHAFRGGGEVLDYFEAGGDAELILSAVVMAPIDGFELCRRLKAQPVTRDIPVIFASGLDAPTDEAYALSIGGEDFIHKPFSAPVVLARVRTHLRLGEANRQLRRRNEDLEQLVAERTHEVRHQAEELVQRHRQVIAVQDATITAFCALAEERDTDTGRHIHRTQRYVRVLAEELRDHPRFRSALDDATIDLLFKSAPLHDIGKVAIPDAILLKPGRLTAAEWEIMKRHAEYGRLAIAQASAELKDGDDRFLRHAADIAQGHHERWDGSGYPGGLAGDAIPLSA